LNENRLEETLSLADHNRGELEKVLNHYQDNPLKYKAAVFLIENMPGKYTEDDRPFEDFEPMFDEWVNRKATNFYVTPEESDSMVLANGLASSKRVLQDIRHIKAAYLINNIDRSFEVWTSTPWGKKIPFEVFCEEILPYRLTTEALENWRDIILEQYRPLYDSLQTSNINLLSACIRIFEAMGLEWDGINKFSALLPETNYRMIHKLKTGPCSERVKYGIYVMRAFGIPINWDYTPQWPFRSMGHDWVSVWADNGQYIPFIPLELKPGEPHKPDHRMAKAFRRSFSINPQSLACISRSNVLKKVFIRKYMFISKHS
jgi:hypothetical protein